MPPHRECARSPRSKTPSLAGQTRKRPPVLKCRDSMRPKPVHPQREAPGHLRASPATPFRGSHKGRSHAADAILRASPLDYEQMTRHGAIMTFERPIRVTTMFLVGTRASSRRRIRPRREAAAATGARDAWRARFLRPPSPVV